ncbi:LOW QUALITY PROTEIN: gasdermin-D-like [Mustela erminea]|uniref:LOW QUALITY PROTEIN: gasdermin-D-like n=1 Tax=Mustela erminea TaxID=36723 RepID=UPI001386DE62|nr:LOW QUALITY PROTEIN: gasdermin-D-like [Mustela erminea]
MASTFEGVVKRVIRELDHGGKLMPVDSLQSSAGFQPYCLLRRKLPMSRFQKVRYTGINLSIRDILEPGAPEPGTPSAGRGGTGGLLPVPRLWAFSLPTTEPFQPSARAGDGRQGDGASALVWLDVKQSTPIRVFDCTDGEALGGGELEAAGQGRLAGKASVSEYLRISMKVCTRKVDPNVWDAMKRERRLRQPEHKILGQLRSCKSDVFVVTEVLQTQEEVTVSQTQKHEGSGQFALLGALSFQGQGQGRRSRKKKVSIPAGTVLAFQVAQLLVDPDWDVLLYWDKRGKRPKTFRPPHEDRQLVFESPTMEHKISRISAQQPRERGWAPLSAPRESALPDQGSPVSVSPLATDGFAEVGPAFTGDFQGLQAEVAAQAQALRGLSRELCGQLLAGLAQVLREERALQTLEDELEQGLSCAVVPTLEGPAGAVLECLVNSSGELEGQLARPVLYLAEALAVLTETQHAVLGKMLETGELSGRLDLVGSVLEQSSPWQQCRDLSLPPELLGSGWGPETPAWVLLEECGLEVQADAPQVRWEPEAQDLTCALFACLALLLGLSPESCWG